MTGPRLDPDIRRRTDKVHKPTVTSRHVPREVTRTVGAVFGPHSPPIVREAGASPWAYSGPDRAVDADGTIKIRSTDSRGIRRVFSRYRYTRGQQALEWDDEPQGE